MMIKVVTLTIVNARSDHISRPPDGQKESQQQSFQMRSHLELGGFDVPATGLGILKGGPDAHA
ncbi:MAG: hypothetical protein NVS4B7_02090 [Ktedonobacteraceae bacterium]